MRDIKFRAWDILRGKMAYDVQNEYDTITGVRFEDGEEPGEDSFGEYLRKREASKYYDDQARYIVEQYTGLKDKHGIDIYEGDIFLGYFNHNEVVSWEDDSSGFYPFTAPAYGGYEWENLNPEDCEILGNIHKNPELMEAKDGTER
jgi:uncharacterized phage protein (TIGR01671 family)